MNRALVAALVVAGLLAGVAAAFYFTRVRGAPPVLERATLFEAPRPLPRSRSWTRPGGHSDRKRLRGHWTFLFFGFVNCPDVCPTTLATLAEARRIVADLPMGEQPAVVLVSVDPARDTPEVLGHYVAHFDPSFTGVTGEADAIDCVDSRTRASPSSSERPPPTAAMPSTTRLRYSSSIPRRARPRCSGRRMTPV